MSCSTFFTPSCLTLASTDDGKGEDLANELKSMPAGKVFSPLGTQNMWSSSVQSPLAGDEEVWGVGVQLVPLYNHDISTSPQFKDDFESFKLSYIVGSRKHDTELVSSSQLIIILPTLMIFADKVPEQAFRSEALLCRYSTLDQLV